MANQHGDFIWYELITSDAQAAKQFYDAVLGWEIGEPEAGRGDFEYAMIRNGEDFVGGVFTLSEEMMAQGARPVWLGYIRVDDIERSLMQLRELGGSVMMPVQSIPQVGPIALVTDPQGLLFYLIQPESGDDSSAAFASNRIGHCAWNELTTPEQESALEFYRQLFGWENKESMPMGEAGEYRFLEQNGAMIGAVSPQVEGGPPPGWTYYFRVADIDAAAAAVAARGGQVAHGPHPVPGDEFIILGLDPEGTGFALVGARKS